MKIYAKQVEPEYQESPLYMEEWPENVYIFGNRHFAEHGAEHIKTLKNGMHDAADELKQLMRGLSYYKSFTDIIDDFLPAPENKKTYSRADRLKWRALLLAFDAETIDDDDATTAALELITGDEYAAATVRGYCQGEWQHIIYPARYSRHWLVNFEIEYFNTGAEWRVTEGDAERAGAYYVYTHALTPDEIKREIAEEAMVDAADVVLLKFDGYTQNARYIVA